MGTYKAKTRVNWDGGEGVWREMMMRRGKSSAARQRGVVRVGEGEGEGENDDDEDESGYRKSAACRRR